MYYWEISIEKDIIDNQYYPYFNMRIGSLMLETLIEVLDENLLKTEKIKLTENEKNKKIY